MLIIDGVSGLFLLQRVDDKGHMLAHVQPVTVFLRMDGTKSSLQTLRSEQDFVV